MCSPSSLWGTLKPFLQSRWYASIHIFQITNWPFTVMTGQKPLLTALFLFSNKMRWIHQGKHGSSRVIVTFCSNFILNLIFFSGKFISTYALLLEPSKLDWIGCDPDVCDASTHVQNVRKMSESGAWVFGKLAKCHLKPLRPVKTICKTWLASSHSAFLVLNTYICWTQFSLSVRLINFVLVLVFTIWRSSCIVISFNIKPP